jgi:cation:H+ antiporter
MAVDIVRIVAGLVILVIAADRLVLSAVRVAKVLDVSTILIGAVIVGFGTSVPEFVVSVIAASDGNLELAMSNVVASNIANVTLVLGVAALMAYIATKTAVIQREGLLMLISVTVFGAVLMSGHVSRIEGVFLLVAMVAALFVLLRWSKGTEADDSLDSIEADRDRLSLEILYGVVALIATVVAGRVLLTGVVGIGAELGLGVVFMGVLTGVGTSLPELSAAVSAARRKQTDIVLGNVLGSNTFNSLGVAGLAAVVGPGDVGGLGVPAIVVMVGVALAAGVFAYTKQRISKLEGLILLTVFFGYAFMSL